ncbi:CRISPR-associated endonuclease Cas1 1 [Caldalkalibacillus thermarum]|uniref:type I-C CRISPR-associated endonuclease Cas1c n=1 Tax=Caldalkalibacillus thermarum TaxID=296745 RepID=UPI00166A3C90|nr:type I-C CRISPR-associated endonuclease Cas1c [Caldalkalibacillus thermarum]GGK34665.1 CRISPR-associated endonuclease Cas1 1 [Caldalkalibacillus thermarum]
MIRTLLNTLYVQTQGSYLRLDHETVIVEYEGEKVLQVPLHHIGTIVVFGNVLISPYLLGKCITQGIAVIWYDAYGRFLARAVGRTSGNVLLRRAQHHVLTDEKRVMQIASRFVAGKLRNSRTVLQRAIRDYPERRPSLEKAVKQLDQSIREVDKQATLNELRGLEGYASSVYFEAFTSLLRTDDDFFAFELRSRRPPRDPINACLSFAYSILTQDCISALEGVGLDPQIGYLHTLRPGRPALALDLIEEFRPYLADRFVLTLINRKQLSKSDFDMRPGGAVLLNEKGRRTFLASYQKRKQEEIQHPIINQRVPLGLLPHVHARLLARYLRGDIEHYVPFIMR